MELDEAKQRVCDEIDRNHELLIDVSHSIHARPELCFDEHHAHDLLTSVLTDAGLDVEARACGLDTAFVARAGSGGPTIGVICEYDALPEIGHACGHNIIAAAGLGAGLAAATLAEELGARVVVLGTPAEEGGGGKVFMLERGAFDGIEAAMMVHPAGVDLLRMNVIAIHQLRATYRGVASHAAAAPQLGRNALDAAVLGYMNVAALRQHIGPDERIHGIFTRAGDKPNVVPDLACSEWYVRSPTRRSLEALEPRVAACLEGGAVAAGCEVDLDWLDPAYDDMVDNQPMLELYAANARRQGRAPVAPGELDRVVGSTDMGNVSHLIPSIHPMIAVAPPDVAIHTPDFTSYAAAESGDQGVVDGAKILAATVVDLWMSADHRQAAATALARDPERSP